MMDEIISRNLAAVRGEIGDAERAVGREGKTTMLVATKYADNDTRLLMNFTHTDNDNVNPGSAKYSPLPETHLPGGTTFHLDVITLNGKEMTLRYTSPDGKEYLYKFKKWA